MNTPQLGPSTGLGGVHPAVLDRRIGDFRRLVLAGVIPAALALGITVALPNTSLMLVLAIIAGALAVVALMANSRLEATVTVLAIYLGLLDGPVKLGIGSHEATAAVPNVLIVAVCAGALMRMVVRRQPMTLPPMSSWVLAFTGIVLIEAFNPQTAGILHILGGFRQQLEWVPFFFFGYILLRTKQRFRKLFLIVGVIGLANGVVSAYQTELSPSQLAGWGPGYYKLIHPESGTGRTYTSEGEGRVRPPALGSDSGFGGGVGVIALPFCLALLATARSRRDRWIAIILCLGSMLAVITGLGRLQVVGAFLGIGAFMVLSALGGRRVWTAIRALLIIVIIAVPAGLLLVSLLRAGTFSRYESLNPSNAAAAPSYKEKAWTKIPHELEVAPFGVGLGTAGPTASFGGKITDLLEGHGVSSETQYNFIANELGAPGLLLWVSLSLYVVAVAVRGMRRVSDGDLAIYLAAMFAPFMALFLEGFSGAFMVSAAAGPYFWLTVGVAAYWFAGPGRSSPMMSRGHVAPQGDVGSPAPAGATA